MANIVLSDGDFDYTTIPDDRFAETLRLEGEVFILGQEPLLTQCDQISAEVITEFCEGIGTHPSCRELSIIAVHRPTGEIAGALLNERLGHGDSPAYSERVLSEFERAFAFLGQIDHIFFEQTGLDPKLCCHEFMLAVHPKWKGSNIGYNLFVASNKLGKEKGLTFALVEVTGPISQHLTIDKLGYQVVHTLEYKNFEYKAVKPYTHVEGNCKIIYKLLE